MLAGFSFGSFVQTRVAKRLAAERMVLVGPAVNRFAAETVPPNTLVIHGEHDDVVPLAAVLDWARPQNLPVVVVPGGEHFFHGRLNLLSDIILRWFGRSAPALARARSSGRQPVVQLRAAGLRKRYGDAGSRRRHRPRVAARRVLRPARAERRGQDDDAAPVPGADRSGRRRDRGARLPGARAGARGAPPHRRRAAGRQSRSGFHRARRICSSTAAISA